MRDEAERAFDEVVASRYDVLRRAAYVLCGDAGHAEDLVQITFLHLHRSWKRVAAVDDLDAYLHVALVNASRTWWRRRWHGEVATAAPPEQSSLDASETVALHATLLSALDELGSKHREVLVLRFLAELSEDETATALGTTVGTVKSRTFRALAALRGTGHFDLDRDAR